jgi:hypothetical protein
VKTLADQVSRKDNTWNLFSQHLEQLHTVLQGAYVKFVLSSPIYFFDDDGKCVLLLFAQSPIICRVSKPTFTRILNEDVPAFFTEDSLCKYPDLMNVFREYLRTKKIDSLLLFFADVYNFKV